MTKRTVLFVFVFVLCAQISFQDEEESTSQADKVAEEFEAPCPLHWDPFPCECSGHSKARNLDCSSASNGHQISQIFQLLSNGLSFNSFTLHDSNISDFLPATFGQFNFISFAITHVKIRSLPDDFFKPSKNTVKEITVSHTQLKNFPFTSLSNYSHLEILVLSHNQIATIPSEVFGPLGLPRLQELDLSENVIVTIESMAFANLPYLNRLNLDGNNLTTLASRTLSNPGMKDVVVVSLKNNVISQIDKDAFSDLMFSSIHLEKNNMKSLPQEIFKPLLNYLEVKDAFLYLDDNEIECDDSIKWLIKESEIEKSHLKNVVCKNGKQLEVLKEEDLKKKE